LIVLALFAGVLVLGGLQLRNVIAGKMPTVALIMLVTIALLFLLSILFYFIVIDGEFKAVMGLADSGTVFYPYQPSLLFMLLCLGSTVLIAIWHVVSHRRKRKLTVRLAQTKQIQGDSHV
jgi:glucan phosphoethanolaminetransferase (alkaline phosphatase superfamily)